MIEYRPVVIQSATYTFDSERNETPSFSTLKTIQANVQPASGRTVSELFGLSTVNSGSILIFYDDDTSILESYRVVVDSKTYEIRAVDRWYGPSSVDKTVALCVPVQGV